MIDPIVVDDVAPARVRRLSDVAGALVLNPATADAASLNIPAGDVPDDPQDGDVWATADGLFVQVDGVTVGPLGAGGGGGGLTEGAFTAFTYATGWADGAPGAYEAGGFIKVGSQVFLHGYFHGDGSGTGAICTLPVGARPAKTLQAYALGLKVAINTDGTIESLAGTSGDGIFSGTSFIAAP